MQYTELQVTSNFSFLRGASHPEELVEQAAEYGYKAIAVTDRNSLAGVVRAHAAAKKKGIRFITGCRLDLLDGPSVLVYPTNVEAYSRLCNLLTLGNRRAEKGECFLYRADIYRLTEGMKKIILPPSALNADFDFDESFKNNLECYRDHFRDDLYLAATRYYAGDDAKYLYRLWQLSKRTAVPLVATNDVHYHHPPRRELQDILTCIREKCTIYNAGYKLHPNAERFLKPADEMQRLFRQYPEAIHNTSLIAESCRFSLDELKYEYPEEITTEGRTPQEEITYLAWKGAREHYGDTLPQ
ncbi:MAG TPA: PHP domain-containing protein, partial [Chitinophagaceae bacterium]|nr:PHP domain-containing protein [Chitinophagaceae bacterium]